MSRLLFNPRLRSARTALPLLLLAASCLDWQSLQLGKCGDRFVGREETCDDGNRWDGDGCNSLCQVEPPACGDGRLDPQEECDDGNLVNDDGCGASCRVEVEVEVAAMLCGNSVLDAGEACDDGGSADGDGCSRLCQLEPSPELCGNASLDDQEVCDDGDDANDDSCLNGCSRATCGDGFQRSGVEECDDGNVNNGDNCSRSCLSCKKTETSVFRPGNAHCYTVHPEPLTQAQARAVCQTEGGELWSVTSDAEGADVLDKRMLNAPLWLGLVTSTTSSSWLTGEGSKYTSFDVGEPSDPALRCVALVNDGRAGKWSSQSCDSKLGFVCERSPANVLATTHHAYRFRTTALTFDEARAQCSLEQGYLATLETEEERAFVGKGFGSLAWVDATDSFDARGGARLAHGPPGEPHRWRQGRPRRARVTVLGAPEPKCGAGGTVDG